MDFKTLDKYFPNSKNSVRGVKYLVVDTGSVSYYKRAKMKCVDCGIIINSQPSNILFGQIPCKCGTNYYRTPERRLERLLEVILDRNYSISNMGNIPTLRSAESKVCIVCKDCNFQWSPVLNSIICNTTGCQRCSKVERYSESYYVDKINNLPNISFISKIGSKIGRQERVLVNCSNCLENFEALVGNLFQGRGCRNCAKHGFSSDQTGYFYILSVKSASQQVLGYKFGITNYPNERLKRIQSKSSYQITAKFIFKFEIGKKALELESSVKQHYGNYFSRLEMADGFTETVAVEDIKNLISHIHKFLNKE